MSDRDIGLLSAAKEVLPNTTKYNCVRHIAKNLMTHFKNRELINKY